MRKIVISRQEFETSPGSANDDTTSVNSSCSLMSTADAVMDDGVYPEEDMKRSEEFKEKGNAYFKGKIQRLSYWCRQQVRVKC